MKTTNSSNNNDNKTKRKRKRKGNEEENARLMIRTCQSPSIIIKPFLFSFYSSQFAK